MTNPVSKLVAAALAATLVAALATAPAAAEPTTHRERVQFDRGESSTVRSMRLRPGEAVSYVLRARNLQYLEVKLSPESPSVHFNVLVPNGSVLYESAKGGAERNRYYGQLYMTGDHTVVVYNNGRRSARFEVQLTVETKRDAGGVATHLPSHPGGGATHLPGSTPGRPTHLPGDALVPGTRYHATGSLRCRIDGRKDQCAYGVVRRGGGDATLVITMPSGVRRTIEFQAGRPVSSNSPAPVYGEWSVGDVTVSVGDYERYRVADAILFGG